MGIALRRLPICFLASLIPSLLPAQVIDFEPLERAIEIEMERFDLPGVSIALLAGDEVVWSRGFGFADRRRTQALTGSSVHRVASISKLFTATAVMRLVEEGKLSLDQPLAEFLPEFKPDNAFSQPITLRQILSHHSGLLREPAVGHYFLAGHSLEDLVSSMNGRSLIHLPGSTYKYSNAAVSIAGFAVQKAAGRPFAAYLDEIVFAPLGMEHSSFDAASSVAQACVEGSMWSLDGRQFAAPTFELGMMPAANLYTNMEDLLRFARSWFFADGKRGDAVISEASQHAMFAPQFGSDFAGLGFFIDKYRGHLRVGHGGAIFGFASQIFALPRERLAVACATTLDFASGSIERIAERALAVLLAAKEGRSLDAWPVAKNVGSAAMRTMVGRYGDDEFWVELSEGDGYLFEIPSAGVPSRYWRFDGGEALLSMDRFHARLGHNSLRFMERDVIRNGKLLARIDPASPPPVAPQRFLPFIGEYGWDHDTLFIFEDAGRLCCLIEWFARYPLTELGTDLYSMPGSGMYKGEKVRFHRDADGHVDAVMVGAVRFPRRKAAARDGETFQIDPLHSPDQLRAMAARATMPPQKAGLRNPVLVDLTEYVQGLSLDIRYASTNNFMGMVFYPEERALMQRPAAEALAGVQAQLAERGYGLLIHDAYRPWSVTKMFWDATPLDLKAFVADPSKGSRHNRGCAVDLSLYDLHSEEPVSMVSGYDEFTERAYPDYPGGTSRQRWHRSLLRRAMEAVGFTVYAFEWWHFDYRDWHLYPILNLPIR